MNNDLISRSELKKTFENACIYGLPMNELYGAILKIIDNAPTVESDYEWGYSEGVHDTERPHGEWIDPQNVGANNWCSVCGEFILHYDGICNYCPNCGADMRKGEEE